MMRDVRCIFAFRPVYVALVLIRNAGVRNARECDRSVSRDTAGRTERRRELIHCRIIVRELERKDQLCFAYYGISRLVSVLADDFQYLVSERLGLDDRLDAPSALHQDAFSGLAFESRA